MGWVLKNYIRTRKKFKIFHKKGKGVLLKIILSNIKKEKFKLKKLIKSN